MSVQGDTGVIGGKISHEYHFISDIGQDELVICENCGHGSNKELAAEDNIDICPKCSSAQLRKSKGIEVGHTFLLGDKYSKIFGAKFMQVKLAYFGVLSFCQIYLESFLIYMSLISCLFQTGQEMHTSYRQLKSPSVYA